MTQKLKVLWSRKFWFIPKSADYPPYEMVEVNQVDDKRTFCKGCNTTRNTLAFYQDLGLDRARFEFNENMLNIRDISKYKNMDLITPTEREARLALKDNQSGLIVLCDNMVKKTVWGKNGFKSELLKKLCNLL